MPTSRDLIWSATSAILAVKPAVTVHDIERELGEQSPSKRTIQDCLSAMTELGVLEMEQGSGSAPGVFQPPSQAGPNSPTTSPPRSSSIFPYPGGKTRLSDWIVSHLPEHSAYAEPFGGSAAVLVNKPPATYEVFNDANGDVVQFFDVLQARHDELVEWLQLVPYSRSLYSRWADEYYDGYRPRDPVERAGRFFSLRYMQFGGDLKKTGFKARIRRSAARSFQNGVDRLSEFASRFRDVILESRDYREILDHYDDDSTSVLFYLDPPYPGRENYYGQNFNHQEFLDRVMQLSGKWMISLDRVPSQLSNYHVIQQERHSKMARKGTTTEFLICNFDANGQSK